MSRTTLTLSTCRLTSPGRFQRLSYPLARKPFPFFTLTPPPPTPFQALLTPLLHYVALARPDFPRGIEGRVNRLTGHVVLKGNWKTEVKQFLLEKGM
jgi:hypothetical protein